MEIRILEPPKHNGSQFVTVGVTTLATKVKYEKHLDKKGTFEIDIPFCDKTATLFTPGQVLKIGEYFGIVQTVQKKVAHKNEQIRVAGFDLKSILDKRITANLDTTATDGTAGFDAVMGSTEHCIKYFWRRNFGDLAVATRVMPTVEIAPNLNRGMSDDKYKTRHENLADVTNKLCADVKMGYDIMANLDLHKFVADVFVGVDRTASQSVVPPIIFSVDRKSLLEISTLQETNGFKNAFYATQSGSEFADEALTLLYGRNTDIPTGFDRTEQHLSISTNDAFAGEEYDELRRLVEKEMKNYEESFELDCKISSKLKLGKDYNLGDFVTIEDKSLGVVMDTQIVGVSVETAHLNENVSLIFGSRKPTLKEKLKNEIRNGG